MSISRSDWEILFLSSNLVAPNRVGGDVSADLQHPAEGGSVVMLIDSVYFALPKIDWEDKMTSNSYVGVRAVSFRNGG